jgi:hypothetical protein
VTSIKSPRNSLPLNNIEVNGVATNVEATTKVLEDPLALQTHRLAYMSTFQSSISSPRDEQKTGILMGPTGPMGKGMGI